MKNDIYKLQCAASVWLSILVVMCVRICFRGIYVCVFNAVKNVYENKNIYGERRYISDEMYIDFGKFRPRQQKILAVCIFGSTQCVLH